MAAAYPDPTIFLGYVGETYHFNHVIPLLTYLSLQTTCDSAYVMSHPCRQLVFTYHTALADPYEILVTDGRMHDIDDEDWDRW